MTELERNQQELLNDIVSEWNEANPAETVVLGELPHGVVELLRSMAWLGFLDFQRLMAIRGMMTEMQDAMEQLKALHADHENFVRRN